jgi:hypothetical protein
MPGQRTAYIDRRFSGTGKFDTIPSFMFIFRPFLIMVGLQKRKLYPCVLGKSKDLVLFFAGFYFTLNK